MPAAGLGGETLSALTRRSFLAMCPPAYAAAGPTTGLQLAFRRLDEYLPQYMREWNTPGLSLAITGPRTILRSRSYGFSHAEARARVSSGTLFQIGSMSKAFVAVAILQLCEEGKLTLDAPLSRYLPWFQIQLKYPEFTIHHVLSHTSGIPANRDDLPSSLYQAVALSERETLFAPGARFAYSNIGYQVLGYLIESVTGEPYPDYLTKRIFEPLGRAGTLPRITNDIRPRLASGYPMYFDDRPPHSSHPLAPGPWIEWTAGDGNIAATAEDLAAFLRMLMNRGAGPRSNILSAKSYQLMTHEAVQIRAGLYYGYGISTRKEDGHTTFAHSGGMPGYSGIMLCDADAGIGVVMLSNGAGNPVLAGEYALKLMRASMAGRSLPTPPAQPATVSNAADYKGTYASPGGKKLVFEAERGRLFLLYAKQRICLERRGEDTFYVKHPDFALFLLRFGRRQSVVVEATYGSDWYAGERFNGPRTFDYPAGWNAFPGHYRSYNPWLSNFRIVLRKGQLLFVHPEGDERTLIPAGAGRFQIGQAPVYEHLRLDKIVHGFAQRANLSGADYYRTSTP